MLAKGLGADVVEAQGNIEALELLRSNHRADLVVTDLMHVNGTGIELMQELSSDPALRGIPVIVQSGIARRLELECWRAGAQGVLEKPYTSEEFLRLVDEVLERRRDPVHTIIELGSEMPSLDYKKEVCLDSRDDRAKLAKDVIAFANYGGGQIVVGVHEVTPGRFVPEGVSKEQIATLEVSRLNRGIRKYLDPPVHVGVRSVNYDRGTFVILDIPAATGSLVLPKSGNDAARLFPGRIYSRTTAAESAEVSSSEDLRRILDRITSARLSPRT